MSEKSKASDVFSTVNLVLDTALTKLDIYKNLPTPLGIKYLDSAVLARLPKLGPIASVAGWGITAMDIAVRHPDWP